MPFNTIPSVALCTFEEHKSRLTQKWILNNFRNVNYIQQSSIKTSNNLTEDSVVQRGTLSNYSYQSFVSCGYINSKSLKHKQQNPQCMQEHAGTYRFFTINMPTMITFSAQQIIFWCHWSWIFFKATFRCFDRCAMLHFITFSPYLVLLF